MKRSLVLALVLMFAPAMASAQVEIGLDAGFSLAAIDDANDNVTSINLPASAVRVGFGAGEALLVESFVGFSRQASGDFSLTTIEIVPGVNFLLGEQFYVRGEAGLSYISADSGGTDESATQYLFGAGVGVRRPLGEAAIFRVEGALDRALENADDGIPASWNLRVLVGISAVAN